MDVLNKKERKGLAGKGRRGEPPEGHAGLSMRAMKVGVNGRFGQKVKKKGTASEWTIPAKFTCNLSGAWLTRIVERGLPAPFEKRSGMPSRGPPPLASHHAHP